MVIKESKVKLSIRERCYFLNINRSSYYKWLKFKPKEVDKMEARVYEVYHKHKGTYGRLRITQELKNTGTTINHKKTYRIMKKLGLKAIIRKKYCVRKYKKENVEPNLLNREFKVDTPLTKLVGDITELRRINGQRHFLYSILDLYSNVIVAANISTNNDWGLVGNAFKQLKTIEGGAIIHSDQGSQFTSNLYKEIAIQKNLIISMSGVGNCYDNAAKESFFGHFKEEFYIYHNPKTTEELYENIFDFIRYYNYERIQMRFKMSPMQYLQAQMKNISPEGNFCLSTQ